MWGPDLISGQAEDPEDLEEGPRAFHKICTPFLLEFSYD